VSIQVHVIRINTTEGQVDCLLRLFEWRVVIFLQYGSSPRWVCVRPLTHSSRIGTIGPNFTPDSSASFLCWCTTCNVIDCLRVLKAVNDVRSCALARTAGAGIWRWIYDDSWWSMCHLGYRHCLLWHRNELSFALWGPLQGTGQQSSWWLYCEIRLLSHCWLQSTEHYAWVAGGVWEGITWGLVVGIQML